MKKQHRENLDRGKKHNEGVVDNHFFSPAGLQAEMLDAGVMDTDGLIDADRVGWLDEAPNFIDFDSKKGGGQLNVRMMGPKTSLLPMASGCSMRSH